MIKYVSQIYFNSPHLIQRPEGSSLEKQQIRNRAKNALVRNLSEGINGEANADGNTWHHVRAAQRLQHERGAEGQQWDKVYLLQDTEQ